MIHLLNRFLVAIGDRRYYDNNILWSRCNDWDSRLRVGIFELLWYLFSIIFIVNSIYTNLYDYSNTYSYFGWLFVYSISINILKFTFWRIYFDNYMYHKCTDKYTGNLEYGANTPSLNTLYDFILFVVWILIYFYKQ